MREIKFRAWDGRRMVYDMMLKANGQDIRVCSWPGYEFMQYTGHKDDSGIEVYENDIVRLTSVMDEVDVGKVVYDAENYKWVVDIGYDFLGFDAIMHTDRGVEVIGNIHDNPELLEEEQSC